MGEMNAQQLLDSISDCIGIYHNSIQRKKYEPFSNSSSMQHSEDKAAKISAEAKLLHSNFRNSEPSSAKNVSELSSSCYQSETPSSSLLRENEKRRNDVLNWFHSLSPLQRMSALMIKDKVWIELVMSMYEKLSSEGRGFFIVLDDLPLNKIFQPPLSSPKQALNKHKKGSNFKNQKNVKKKETTPLKSIHPPPFCFRRAKGLLNRLESQKEAENILLSFCILFNSAEDKDFTERNDKNVHGKHSNGSIELKPSFDFLLLSEKLLQNFKLFVLLMDELSWCQFLRQKEPTFDSSWEEQPWLSSLGYYSLASFITNKIEITLLKSFQSCNSVKGKQPILNIYSKNGRSQKSSSSLPSSSSSSSSSSSFSTVLKIDPFLERKWNLMEWWKNISPSVQRNILCNIFSKTVKYKMLHIVNNLKNVKKNSNEIISSKETKFVRNRSEIDKFKNIYEKYSSHCNPIFLSNHSEKTNTFSSTSATIPPPSTSSPYPWLTGLLPLLETSENFLFDEEYDSFFNFKATHCSMNDKLDGNKVSDHFFSKERMVYKEERLFFHHLERKGKCQFLNSVLIHFQSQIGKLWESILFAEMNELKEKKVYKLVSMDDSSDCALTKGKEREKKAKKNKKKMKGMKRKDENSVEKEKMEKNEIVNLCIEDKEITFVREWKAIEEKEGFNLIQKDEDGEEEHSKKCMDIVDELKENGKQKSNKSMKKKGRRLKPIQSNNNNNVNVINNIMEENKIKLNENNDLNAIIDTVPKIQIKSIQIKVQEDKSNESTKDSHLSMIIKNSSSENKFHNDLINPQHPKLIQCAKSNRNKNSKKERKNNSKNSNSNLKNVKLMDREENESEIQFLKPINKKVNQNQIKFNDDFSSDHIRNSINSKDSLHECHHVDDTNSTCEKLETVDARKDKICDFDSNSNTANNMECQMHEEKEENEKKVCNVFDKNVKMTNEQSFTNTLSNCNQNELEASEKKKKGSNLHSFSSQVGFHSNSISNLNSHSNLNHSPSQFPPSFILHQNCFRPHLPIDNHSLPHHYGMMPHQHSIELPHQNTMLPHQHAHVQLWPPTPSLSHAPHFSHAIPSQQSRTHNLPAQHPLVSRSILPSMSSQMNNQMIESFNDMKTMNFVSSQSTLFPYPRQHPLHSANLTNSHHLSVDFPSQTLTSNFEISLQSSSIQNMHSMTNLHNMNNIDNINNCYHSTSTQNSSTNHLPSVNSSFSSSEESKDGKECKERKLNENKMMEKINGIKLHRNTHENMKASQIHNSISIHDSINKKTSSNFSSNAFIPNSYPNLHSSIITNEINLNNSSINEKGCMFNTDPSMSESSHPHLLNDAFSNHAKDATSLMHNDALMVEKEEKNAFSIQINKDRFTGMEEDYFDWDKNSEIDTVDYSNDRVGTDCEDEYTNTIWNDENDKDHSVMAVKNSQLSSAFPPHDLNDWEKDNVDYNEAFGAGVFYWDAFDYTYNNNNNSHNSNNKRSFARSGSSLSSEDSSWGRREAEIKMVLDDIVMGIPLSDSYPGLGITIPSDLHLTTPSSPSSPSPSSTPPSPSTPSPDAAQLPSSHLPPQQSVTKQIENKMGDLGERILKMQLDYGSNAENCKDFDISKESTSLSMTLSSSSPILSSYMNCNQSPESKNNTITASDSNCVNDKDNREGDTNNITLSQSHESLLDMNSFSSSSTSSSSSASYSFSFTPLPRPIIVSKTKVNPSSTKSNISHGWRKSNHSMNHTSSPQSSPSTSSLSSSSSLSSAHKAGMISPHYIFTNHSAMMTEMMCTNEEMKKWKGKCWNRPTSPVLRWKAEKGESLPPPPSTMDKNNGRVRSGSSSPRHWNVTSINEVEKRNNYIQNAKVMDENVRKKNGSSVKRKTEVIYANLPKEKFVFDRIIPPESTAIELDHYYVGDSSVDLSLSKLHASLHSEIEFFQSQVTLEMKARKPFHMVAIKKVTRVLQALWPRSRLSIFGSNATGLALPSSDIDMVVFLPPVRSLEPIKEAGILEGRNGIKETCLQHASRFLAHQDWVKSDSIKTIENTLVPVIMLVAEISPEAAESETDKFLIFTNSEKDKILHMREILNQKSQEKSNFNIWGEFNDRKRVRLDISFEGVSHTGLKTAELVRELTTQFLAMPPLFFIIKKFLTDRKLDHSYTGGLSSYCLVLLIICFLQNQQKFGRPQQFQNLGSLLLDFFYFFGCVFDPRRICISIRAGGEYIQRERNQSIDPLYIEDPLNVTNNVGRNCFRIFQCTKAFADAYALLNDQISELNLKEEEDTLCSPSGHGFLFLSKLLPTLLPPPCA